MRHRLSHVIAAIVLLFRLIKSAQSEITAMSNCPPNNRISFEKVLGQRPALKNSMKLFAAKEKLEGITTECLRLCRNNANCAGFVLSYGNLSCIALTDEVLRPAGVIYDPNFAWFRKLCFANDNCDKLWTIERIPAATLIGNNTKRLPVLQSRENCAQKCLDESSFHCRSAKFRTISQSSLGECILSDSDRYQTPQAFRVSGNDEEYIENQCSDFKHREYCAFEEYPDVRLSNIDATYANLTQLQCQKECEQFEAFTCRGYSLIPSKRKAANKLFTCAIHSENSKVHGPKSLLESPGAIYFERAPCLNVKILCNDTDMKVEFMSDTEFNGRIYMKGYSNVEECYANGNHSHRLELSIPLKATKCGLAQVNSPQNRTLFATTMILQYNNIVQTQADRIIKIGCIFGDSSSKVVIGTGYNITDEPTHSGNTNINSSLPNQPMIEMRIVDLNSNEIGDTEIGDDLQLIIEMRPSQSGLDMWAGHLVAMTENGRDSILLLDDQGCPTNLDVFPRLSKTIDENAIRLTATFQAFKFSSSNVIRFSVMVQFCNDMCPLPQCYDDTPSTRLGRSSDLTISSNNSQLNATSSVASKFLQMPLECTLIVHSSNIEPDKLVYGDNTNKLLVAGYDYANNEICFDFSLVIGLVLLWLLLQIILLVSCFMLIRKYKKYYEDQHLHESLEELHKNFGLGFTNLDSRRQVHFNDVNVMT